MRYACACVCVCDNKVDTCLCAVGHPESRVCVCVCVCVTHPRILPTTSNRWYAKRALVVSGDAATPDTTTTVDTVSVCKPDTVCARACMAPIPGRLGLFSLSQPAHAAGSVLRSRSPAGGATTELRRGLSDAGGGLKAGGATGGGIRPA